MAKKNLALLKRLRTRFLRMRHPEHFDMFNVAEETACGTAMCIAGHALDLQGYRFKPKSGGYGWITPSGRRLRNDPLEEAQRLLGLTHHEALEYTVSSVARKDKASKHNGLFYRWDLKTPKQAAKAIEKLIGAE